MLAGCLENSVGGWLAIVLEQQLEIVNESKSHFNLGLRPSAFSGAGTDEVPGDGLVPAFGACRIAMLPAAGHGIQALARAGSGKGARLKKMDTNRRTKTT